MNFKFLKLNILLLVLLPAASMAGASELNLISIDSHIQKSEAAFTDIVDGAEKYIRWFADVKQKQAVSIVYIHGFSATRQEVSPLVELLADQRQANVYFTRLQGHGRDEDAMAEGSVEGWKQEALLALATGHVLGDKVILMGTSTGGTLITWLNSQYEANDVYASVLISPNFEVMSKSAHVLQWSLGRWFVSTFVDDYHSFEPLNDFHKKYWTERYPIEAAVPMLDLVDEVFGLDKTRIATPQLIVYSPNDQIVNPDATIATATQMKSANVTLVPFTISKDPVQHLLVGKMSSPNEVDDMLQIIDSFLNSIEEI
ncbi:MAG: esterase/lipase [Arenicella sp.]|jgi:esterase/lipase